jgi:hypothetical protein
MILGFCILRYCTPAALSVPITKNKKIRKAEFKLNALRSKCSGDPRPCCDTVTRTQMCAMADY